MKAALYCRLSEEDRGKLSRQDDSASIQNQKQMLLDYAARQGWEVYQIYSDDDYAGADRRRPAFNQLLRDGEAGKFQIVLCKTQSRFTRELELVEKYLHTLFPLWGIRFVSIVDHADTENRGNKKARQINGLVNEWYLEDLSENIRSVLTSRRAGGYHIGSSALYGYRKDPERKGHLVPDPEAARVVRWIFSRYAGGMGKTAIARQLNQAGVPCPAEYRRLCRGLSLGGGLWRYPAIDGMLRNEMYAGHLVQGKFGSVSYKTKQNRPRPKEQWIRVPDAHRPLVSPALWAAVQARLAEGGRPYAGGEIGPFSGVARCWVCGAPLRSSRSHGRRYLHCPTRNVAPDRCPGAFLAEETLSRLVLEGLNWRTEDLLTREQLEELRQAAAPQAVPPPNARTPDQDQRAQALEQLYLDRAAGRIGPEDFQAVLARLGPVPILPAETAAEPEPGPPVFPVTRLSRGLVLAFVERILVGRRPGPGLPVPVRISWRF